MATLKIYSIDIPREQIAHERAIAYLNLSPLERFQEIFALNALAIALNDGKPLKTPQGKGLVIRRKKSIE